MRISPRALGQMIIGGVLAAASIVVIGGIIVLIHSYYFIENHLAGDRQNLPSTIYASAPVLQPGSPRSAEWLIDYLHRLDYHKASGSIPRSGEYSISKQGIAFRKSAAIESSSDSAPVLVVFNRNGVARIQDLKTSDELPQYPLQPAPITDLVGDQWQKRLAIPIRQMPENLIKAVIAIEDRRFYHHAGVDLRAILRAAWQNVTHRGPLQGASTITQQLVKNFYLTPERSLRRKTSEVIMAILLERRLSKARILELYMNQVYLGQRGPMSISGVGAASRLYFHKDVRDLTLPEAALIAGLIRAPNVYNPYRHMREARNRRNTVLAVMKDTGDINDAEYQQATEAPIKVYPIDTRVSLAPYFGDLVKQQLLAKYKPDDIYRQNLHVFTTVDLDMQEAAEEALTTGLQEIDRLRIRRVRKEAQGCLIAIEPSTGYIRAFVGGKSYSESQFNRLIQASRQPGSSFKPVVYAAALEMAYQGTRAFTPATLISDEPTAFHYQNILWQPQNYDGEYHGIVSMRMALAQSMNVATAKLAENVGLGRIVALANQLGITSVRPFPSLSLGVFEVSPWQLAEAYTVFANQGMKTELQAIASVTDANGKTIENRKPEEKRVLHPETAFLITDMLRTAMTEGTAGASQRMGIHFPAAGKTGTTNDFRDAWFIGYTPDLLCLVWTGYDGNQSIGMNGAQAALPIWARFMRKVAQMKGAPRDFQMPAGIVSKVIDPTTGKLAGPDCWETKNEFFISGTEPTEICTDADHQSPNVVDFSNNTALVHQIQQDEMQVPQFETPSNDAESVIQDEEANTSNPQPTYITPDPEVHRILNGGGNTGSENDAAVDQEQQGNGSDVEQNDQGNGDVQQNDQGNGYVQQDDQNNGNGDELEKDDEDQAQTQPN